MSRPKLWGPDLLRGDETNNVEEGDLMVGIFDGVVRLAVREDGQWVTDAFSRRQDTWRLVMKSQQTGRGGAMSLDPDLQLQAPAGDGSRFVGGCISTCRPASAGDSSGRPVAR